MPINVGNNLTLKNNTIDATYGELFYKLNKAYAWTHTQSTATSGTAAFILPTTPEIYYVLPITSSDNVYISRGGDGGAYDVNNNLYMIDGKAYKKTIPEQVGEYTDYKEIQSNYGITTDGKLWNINASTGARTQIGIETNWKTFSKTTNALYVMTNDGKLYYNPGNPTQVGSSTGWTWVYTEYSAGYRGICNGYLYSLSGTTATLLNSQINNFTKVLQDDAEILSLTSDGYLYRNDLFDTPFMENVVDIFPIESGAGGHFFAISSDGKLYYLNGGNKKLIDNTMVWTSAIGRYNNGFYCYGVADGKLYYISNIATTPVLTQIGTETTWKKVDGNQTLFIATADDGMTISHTVYTTKTPSVGDITYIDNDLTAYSEVLTTSGLSITDRYGVYDRDASKDSTFTAIPTATMHETVSTLDFLRITNPNT